MRRHWRSLRGQLALFGFLAIYLPVLALVMVSAVTEETVTIDGVEITEGASTQRSPWATGTTVALAPAAAILAWWLAGRAVRPIDRVRTVAEDIEGSDLARRIGLDHGPAEVVALASSFDAMFDRLEQAADAQRQLIEETSHELRTPLAVLTTNADVLLAHPRPTLEQYRRGLERSRSAAARLRSTLDELLLDARGRARTIDRRPADLVDITRTVVDEASVLAAAKRVDVSISGPPTAPGSFDAPTVQRALANLVDNAIRFAPAGSTVELDVSVTDGEAVITVTDHGPGIPAAEQHRVFERSWRGRADAEGTGLGLPIAQQIAAAHGGALTLTSPGSAGNGCTFELRLRR